MIKQITEDNPYLVSYIGEDYNKCLYLYLNYKKYGIENENIKIWIQKNEKNEITALVLMYYTGMHIFSKENDCDFNELRQLILKEKPTIICSEKSIIGNLNNDLNEYKCQYGWVRELNSLDESYNDKSVCVAKLEDFKEIAELIYNDKETGSIYDYDVLLSQLENRYKEKYARNYFAREDGKIVSHAATGAENSELGVVSYVITHKDYRRKGLAKKTVGKLCYDLINENKKVYLINYSYESTELYDRIGFEVSCEIGKLYIDLKEKNNN